MTTRLEPSWWQQEAAEQATTVEKATQWGIYATPGQLAAMRDDGIRRCITHLLNHDPNPGRQRVIAEYLALSVENQLSKTPGGRLFLVRGRLPRIWWEESSCSGS